MAYRPLNEDELRSLIEWIVLVEFEVKQMLFVLTIAYPRMVNRSLETELKVALEALWNARTDLAAVLNAMEKQNEDR